MSDYPQLIASRYQVAQKIGAGGMGIVYRGVDLQTNETVAIKSLRADVIDDPATIERFLREAELLRQLNHPNIVKILATVQSDDRYYLIMEYVPGGSLQERLRAGIQLTLQEVLKISIELVDALTRAHYLQIIHRDLKPANVLLAEDGTPRLADFGIALVVSNHERLTDTGESLGTLDYISPEALNGEVVDARADIWALGVMLFEMVSRRRPFQGGTLASLLHAILTDPPPDLETLCPDAPVALVDLIYRMLEKDRTRRIPTMRLVGAELEFIMHRSDALAVKPSKRTRTSMQITLPTTVAPRHNLPAQPTLFVGRESELAELTALLNNADVRLITVVAPGGMGKTRLALAAAERQLDIFSNGVYFVSLALLTSPESIILEIAAAVGYQFQRDKGKPQTQLLDYLQSRKLLLILDNFEVLLEGTTIVSAILQVAPGVKIIATSRERLKLTGETTFHLSGMAFPERETLSDLMGYGAVQLFVQSAQRVRPGIELSRQDLLHIAGICRIVRGMPLGLLLAAAWVEMLMIEEIAQELTRGLDLLETDLRDVPERQRSIRVVFEYSWRWLSDDEQRSFMKLAVFRGGFTREAAQTVVAASLKMLQVFVNKSLLSRSAEGRYEIHELLRQYAEEHLDASGEAEATRNAHSAYYMQFLYEREVDIKGHRQLAALDELEADFENIRAAWGQALAQKQYDALDRVVETLTWFCIMRTRYRESEELFGLVDNQAGEEATQLKGRILLRKLRIQRWREGSLNRYPDITAELEQILAFAQAHHDQTEFMAAQFVLADVTYTLHHDPTRAFALFEECLGYYRTTGDPFNEAWVLHFMANYSLPVAGVQQSIKFQHQILDLRREIGDEIGVIYSLYNLSSTLLLAGDLTQSKTFAQEMREISRQIGERSGDLMAGTVLSQIAFLDGDFETARHIAQKTLELATDLNHPLGKSYSLSLLGMIACLQDDYVAAQPLLQEGMAAAQQSTARFVANFGLSLVACGLQNYEAAQEYHSKALQFVSSIKGEGAMLWCLPVAALLEARLGDKQRAAELLALSCTHSASAIGWLEAWSLLDELHTELETELGESVFATSWSRGSRQNLERALAILLAEYESRSGVAQSSGAQFPARILSANTALVDPLSERELEVLGLIASGLSNQEIADKLVVGMSTVKKHITHIYDKLSVTSRTQAIVRAQELNLV